MDIYARRRARLALLVEERAGGNIAEFARAYGYSRSQISQFLSETYNGGRSIGERAARTIDERTGNPPGWLDLQLSENERVALSRPFSTAELRVATDTTQPIDSLPTAPYLDRINILAALTTNSEGVVDSYDEIDQSKYWKRRYLDFYSAKNTFAVQVKSASLSPRIKKGEFIVVEDGTWGRPGDEVFVQFEDERKAVFQLLYEREGECTFGSVVDGAIALTVKEDEITAMGIIVSVFNRFAAVTQTEA